MTEYAYNGNIKIHTSKKVYKLENAPISVKIGSFLKMALFGWLIGLIPVGIYHGLDYYFDFEAGWLWYAQFVVIALFLWVGIDGLFKNKVTRCPYCERDMGRSTNSDLTNRDKQKVQCERCYELLIIDNGSMRAFTKEDTKPDQRFEAPVFENSIWPPECIACGDPITHREELKAERFNGELLVLGLASTSSGSISNIPYCDKHRKVVSLKIKADGKLWVSFPDFEMFKRFLTINTVRKILVFKQ
ncbi:hypothetical protein BKI52_14565 [marine bacterium AO1-C]|nr:hypothetical protein BKI52_14565 [marine bacterium AO1-C]